MKSPWASPGDDRIQGGLEPLPCGCLLGMKTGGEKHESWCPNVTGDFDGLPRLDETLLGLGDFDAGEE